VGLPLQPIEVGLSPDTGCVVPQPCATGGTDRILRVLGRNQRPAVPGVDYPDTPCHANPKIILNMQLSPNARTNPVPKDKKQNSNSN
jgi:hypothetical protein